MLVIYKVFVIGEVDNKRRSSQQFELANCRKRAELLVISKVFAIGEVDNKHNVANCAKLADTGAERNGRPF